MIYMYNIYIYIIYGVFSYLVLDLYYKSVNIFFFFFYSSRLLNKFNFDLNLGKLGLRSTCQVFLLRA